MSAATEIADREARAAEAEYPDAETEEENEPEPEPDAEPDSEPSEPPSDVQAEAVITKIDREAARYGKAIAKIIQGSVVAPNQCPCCVFPGLVFGFNPHDADDQMRKAAVDAYFGQSGPDYKTATDAEMCQTCDGYGEVLTGARTDHGRIKPCIMCQGNGWVTKHAPPQLAVAQIAQPYPGAEVNYSPVPAGIPDAWNRPAGHPHWGMEPSMIGA